MINSLTQHLNTNGTGQSPLIEQLSRRADVNRDGTVTTAEFSDFLSGLMKSIEAEATKTPPPAATAAAPSAVAPRTLEASSASSHAAASALRTAIAHVLRER